MASASKAQRPPRIVMTTLLLTQEVTREDRGSQGNYVLYGSSCSRLTEEAEYVRKGSGDTRQPQPGGTEPETQSGGWSGPIMTVMMETEEQLLLVRRDNQMLTIELEATREAGAQALRSASQHLHRSHQSRAEELKKSHESEKQQIQAFNLQREEELQRSSTSAHRLAEGIRERCSRIVEMEQRVKRMEEEKKTLIEKKMALEKVLQQMMARNGDGKGCLDLQQQILTLREKISHLQQVIQEQHRGLRGVIQEAEELKNQLRSQDERIESLTEKLTALEAQNQELKDKVKLWSGQPKAKVSRAVWTGASRAPGASPYLLLSRLKQQES